MFPSRYHHSAARMTFEEFAKSVNEAVKNSKPTILIYPPPRFITFRPRFAVPPAMKKSREKCRPNFFLNYEILRIIPGCAQAGESPSPRLFPPLVVHDASSNTEVCRPTNGSSEFNQPLTGLGGSSAQPLTGLRNRRCA